MEPHDQSGSTTRQLDEIRDRRGSQIRSVRLLPWRPFTRFPVCPSGTSPYSRGTHSQPSYVRCQNCERARQWFRAHDGPRCLHQRPDYSRLQAPPDPFQHLNSFEPILLAALSVLRPLPRDIQITIISCACDYFHSVRCASSRYLGSSRSAVKRRAARLNYCYKCGHPLYLNKPHTCRPGRLCSASISERLALLREGPIRSLTENPINARAAHFLAHELLDPR
ncbi:putative 23 kDa nucleic acid binding protein [Indian citrus ringspot virus]|uniref:23kDa protein n=2 Tax=Indian citrus ringspot virus TaxID=104664 RepID=VNBP_ICRSV|nr:putative 23 kDa nucleic acid binding protein [Indian citrus ringspot virus]Q9QEE6.1 RecName: Full=23kDa protein; AltName: Full=Putative 23 kDa nucleic acid binding protein [Indian citrus ringspot virus K1]AAF01314.1 23kDa protein [Indian citrus ringspot virus]AAK97527.1 putative 23 kDa nucleic acid binding protein [Indian citrus ringspot virus]